MNLQDVIKADMSIFLNTKEFAKKICVEGREVEGIFDDEDLVPRQNGNQYDIASDCCVLYAQTDHMPKRRSAGAILNINGKEYTINKWSETAGMSIVMLDIPVSV